MSEQTFFPEPGDLIVWHWHSIGQHRPTEYDLIIQTEPSAKTAETSGYTRIMVISSVRKALQTYALHGEVKLAADGTLRTWVSNDGGDQYTIIKHNGRTLGRFDQVSS